MTTPIARSTWLGLISLGGMHAIVDASCVGMLYSATADSAPPIGAFWLWFLAYDAIAFGFQPLFGSATDTWRAPRLVAALGCGMTAIGVMLFGPVPILALCIVGIGNALFHVGAGCISINQAPGRATAPGIFVAPGALGLTLGTMAGASGYSFNWVFVLLLLVSCPAILLVEVPAMDLGHLPLRKHGGAFAVTLVLLLTCIAIRSLVSLACVFPWKADTSLLLMLTAAIVGGKAVGGIVADRLGWLYVAIASLLFSAPLITLGADQPFSAILGMFLFQMTMPITLAAVGQLFPGRSSFAFGLASFALLVGALPVLTGYSEFFSNRWLILFLVILSTVTVFVGLRQLPSLSRKIPLNKGTGPVFGWDEQKDFDYGCIAIERRTYVG